MNKISTLTRKALSNPAILYVISRYGTYIIQFLNSLFIAVYLGPYYLGVWGFISLVIGYVEQFNLGVSHSVNVIISVKNSDEHYVKKIIGNGVSMILCLSFILALFFLFTKVGLIQIGNKYNFNTYIFLVAIISILTHLNGLLSTIFRVFGKIYAIAINQSLYPIILLFIIPFFRKESLLWAMLISNSIALIFSLVLYLFQSPVKIKPLFEWKIFKYIQIKGWHLFIYNTSFYLILLTTRTFISSNYTVTEFGYFTFSYSLANAVLLLLNSISFLVYPKLLNRFATLGNEQLRIILRNVRTAYISLSHLLIHFVIMFFPLFLFFFPAYSNSSSVFKLTALTVVLYTNSFGYQGVLIGKGKEKLLGYIAFGALTLNILLSAFLIYVVNVSFDLVILSTLITYLIYVGIIGKFGKSILGTKSSFISTFKDVFPWRMILPFIVSLIFIFINTSEWFFIIPFTLYLILNYKDITVVKEIILKVVNNPNFINI
jgi:O-antigen/teichoic acid export membrane protein